MLIFSDETTNPLLLKELLKAYNKAEHIKLNELDEEEIQAKINAVINDSFSEILFNLCSLDKFYYNLIYFYSNRRSIFNIDFIDIYSLDGENNKNIKDHYYEKNYLIIQYGYLYEKYDGVKPDTYMSNIFELIQLIQNFTKLYFNSNTKQKIINKIESLDFKVNFIESNNMYLQPNINIKSKYENVKIIMPNTSDILPQNTTYYLFNDSSEYMYNFSYSSFYDNEFTNFYI